jgi:hypothetical protein
MGSQIHTALCYGSTFHSSLSVDCKYKCRAQWSSIRTSGQTSDQNKKKEYEGSPGGDGDGDGNFMGDGVGVGDHGGAGLRAMMS